jgi:predicted metalloprotease
MTFRNDANLDTSQVSDQRGSSGLRRTGMIAGGGGAGLLVLVLTLLVNGLGGSGSNPLGDLADLANPSAGGTGLSHCKTGADANTYEDCRIVGYVDSIQAYWATALPASGTAYATVQTVFFTDSADTGCGAATSQTGPFYCPADRYVYIDLGFFQQLQTQFGAKGGPFAEGYVLAHEYGHHVQDLQGTLDQSSSQQGAQGQSVRTELQADCFAGVWASHATETNYLQPLSSTDISEALDAASAVGDDRIQSEMQGSVHPESWMHGSSAQRVHWFTVGYQQGSVSSCDTFSGSI